MIPKYVSSLIHARGDRFSDGRRRNSGTWKSATICVLGCLLVASPLYASEAADSVVGIWSYTDMPAAMPEECRDATSEFKSDGTVIVRSGAQVLTGRYRLEPAGQGAFMLLQSDLTSNGKPNCQGLDAGEVLRNYIYRAYIEIDNDELVMHLGETPTAPSLTMVRVRP